MDLTDFFIFSSAMGSWGTTGAGTGSSGDAGTAPSLLLELEEDRAALADPDRLPPPAQTQNATVKGNL